MADFWEMAKNLKIVYKFTSLIVLGLKNSFL